MKEDGEKRKEEGTEEKRGVGREEGEEEEGR